MNIKILAVGKIKEKFNIQAAQEYIKRLGGYCSLSITEISATKIFSDTESEFEKYKKDEAQKILSVIKENDFVVTLEIEGKQLSSENFAKKIEEISNMGIAELVFVIGGANGLHESVLKRSDFALSFSKMTFTHQLMRVLLLEQIYRAFKILRKEAYHR